LSGPFDNARYEALLEGLEITVARVSEVLASDVSARIDSAYYCKEQLALREKAKDWPLFGKYCDRISCGPFGSTILETNYQETGVPMLRPFNLRNMRSDANEVVFLSPDFVRNNGLKVFCRNDLAFARVGDVGCSIITQDEVTISPNIIACSLKQTLNPAYAAIFFNTKFGRLQMEGAIKAVAQPTISTSLIRELRLPVISKKIQTQLQEKLETIDKLVLESRALLVCAEQALLDALGLADWRPPEPLTYMRSSKDVMAAGRFDSQYFAPAKAAAHAVLKQHGSRCLADCVRTIRELVVPGAADSPVTVRNFDLPDALLPVLDDRQPLVETDSLGSVKKRLRDGDVVISRLRSYLKEIAVVRTGSAIPAVGSSEFIVLRPKAEILSPETLAVFLRLTPAQMILAYSQDGSNHPRFAEDVLLSISVPNTVFDMDSKIAALFCTAHALRQQSQILLDRAQQAVEVAIEEGEAAGMAILA